MRQTICLCMIVKDEIEVLKNALDSVVDLLDYWVIADTGSTDGTQAFVKEYFKDKDIPGEFYEDEWVNFAKNRQLVFERAIDKADYLMTLDADEMLITNKGNKPIKNKKVSKLPKFSKDLIRTYTHLKPWVYKRAQFFKGDLAWKWAEGLHEYPYLEKPHSEQFVDNIAIYTEGGGARGKENDRLLKDIQQLEESLEKTPTPRNFYNIAMTQQSRGDYGSAIAAYDSCIEMTSWDEERYMALISKGQCLVYSGRRSESMVVFAEATRHKPDRPEAYYWLAEQHFHNKQYILCRLILEHVLKIPFPKDQLSLVDTQIYDWKITDVLSLCYYFEAESKKAAKMMRKLLTDPTLDIDKGTRERLEANFALFKRVSELPRKHRITREKSLQQAAEEKI